MIKEIDFIFQFKKLKWFFSKIETNVVTKLKFDKNDIKYNTTMTSLPF